MDSFRTYWAYLYSLPFDQEDLNQVINLHAEAQYINGQLEALFSFSGLDEAYLQSVYESNTAYLQEAIIILLQNCYSEQIPQIYVQQLEKKYKLLLQPDGITQCNFQELFSEVLYDMMVMFEDHQLNIITRLGLQLEFDQKRFFKDSKKDIHSF